MPPRTAPRGCVATGHPLAAQAAAEVLLEGGSAVDAAIAADAVMGVVEPMATALGGDLMAMLVQPDGSASVDNGSGRAPAALEPAQVAALPGGRIPERHGLAVTTPGVVRGWADLSASHGRLPLARLLAPAVRVAREGFMVAPVAAREWLLFAPALQGDKAAALLFRAARPPRAGEHFANPELATTLQAIATDGPDALYRGAPARAAAAAVQRHGGVLAEADFAAHTGEFTTPLQASFRGCTVLACPPNAQGLAVLRALEKLQPLALDEHDPHTTVQVVAAMADALDEAQRTVADPAGNTVCTVVTDAQGATVTLMSSLFKRFGSGIAVPGCGFMLQNRGFGFAAPGQLNGAAPGRRPYHTVVPGAALRGGRPWAAFGVVGGLMQPQGQLQLLLRLAAWQQPPQAAVHAPRWRIEPGRRLALEAGMSAPVVRALREAGYAEPQGGELGGRSDFGGAQVLLRGDDGLWLGVTDARKDGAVRLV